MNLWNFLQSLGRHWATTLWSRLGFRAQYTWLASVSSGVLNTSYVTARNEAKASQLFLAAELKSTALSGCVMKFHSTNRPCNRICSGMLAESFTGITRLLQGHLLIFILREEPVLLIHLPFTSLYLGPKAFFYWYNLVVSVWYIGVFSHSSVAER